MQANPYIFSSHTASKAFPPQADGATSLRDICERTLTEGQTLLLFEFAIKGTWEGLSAKWLCIISCQDGKRHIIHSILGNRVIEQKSNLQGLNSEAVTWYSLVENIYCLLTGSGLLQCYSSVGPCWLNAAWSKWVLYFGCSVFCLVMSSLACVLSERKRAGIAWKKFTLESNWLKEVMWVNKYHQACLFCSMFKYGSIYSLTQMGYN